MTKAEVYKMVIDMQRKSGQGCSGIVKLGNDPSVAGHLDDLVEEGLIKACHTGGSLGHPETNIFYMPTKGYNVWEDDDGEYSRHKGKYLRFVRFYLGVYDFRVANETGDEQEDLKRKWLNPTMFDYIRDPDLMKSYAEWLERNKEELEIMINLSDFYPGAGVTFTDQEKEEIKSRSWYEENKKISDCLRDSESRVSNRKEFIRLSKQILELYERKGDSQKEIDTTKVEIEEAEKEILFRKKLHSWFNEQDMNANIQDVFGKEKETV